MKEDFGLDSPDRADAFCLCYFSYASTEPSPNDPPKPQGYTMEELAVLAERDPNFLENLLKQNTQPSTVNKGELQFSYVGYKRQRLNIADNMKVVMHEDHKLLDEVMVTTQKRNQSAVEVPVAVSALSGNNLQMLNVKQMDEMAQYIPGLQVQLQSPNNPGYVIRGFTSDDGESYSQPRISVFQDGVPMSRSRASVVELFDMERVEDCF